MGKELPQVISQKEGRINLVEHGGGPAIHKKTREIEAVQLAMLHHVLAETEDNKIQWEDDIYTISVPEFISWDEQRQILQMGYCAGENLEIALRHARGAERLLFVDLSAQIVGWMRRGGVLWRDAAPRNTLIDRSNKRVVILDFERPLVLKSRAFEEKEFRLLVRGNIHEEFCGFLFPEEQEKVFPNIWDGDEEAFLDIQNILSGRQLILLTHLYGKQDGVVKVAELAHAQRMMSETVTPFYIDGEPFFPLIYLEKATTASEYINKVLELQNKPRELWKKILSA